MKSLHHRTAAMLALLLVAAFGAGAIDEAAHPPARAHGGSRHRPIGRSPQADSSLDRSTYERPLEAGGPAGHLERAVAMPAALPVCPPARPSFRVLGALPAAFTPSFQSVDSLASSGRPPPAFAA